MTVSYLKNICLIFIVISITGLSEYLPDILNSTFGIPYPRFTYLFLFLLPVAVLLNFSIQKNH